LPQGLPKKIKLHLLLTDLAFQLGNPPLGLRQIALRRRGSAGIGWFGLDQLARPTTAPQRCWPAGSETGSPLVEILAQDLQLARQRAHILASQHAVNRRQLHRSIKDTGLLLRHQFSP
jgi:hypothetical protein